MEGNLSQTSCNVPSTLVSIELVSLLQTVNTEFLLHSICMRIFYVLSGYEPELSRLMRCRSIKIRPAFPYRYW